MFKSSKSSGLQRPCTAQVRKHSRTVYLATPSFQTLGRNKVLSLLSIPLVIPPEPLILESLYRWYIGAIRAYLCKEDQPVGWLLACEGIHIPLRHTMFDGGQQYMAFGLLSKKADARHPCFFSFKVVGFKST